MASTGTSGPPKRRSEQRLGAFVLVDELVSTGVVRTFRALYQPEARSPAIPLAPGAHACVRVLRDVSARDGDAMEKFSREAELLALVDHPNVARSITRGTSAGRVWHALEYIEGETLDTLLAVMQQEELRLKPELVVSIAADLLAGLAAVQSLHDPRGRPLGLIHRNVTPRNVMVDHTGTARLVDLGSALLSLREEPAADVVGTLGWLAPEQARRDQLTQGVDVYQVGLLMFELLTGRRVFPVENKPDDEALRMHRNNDRARWPRGLELPVEVKALVDQALGATPEERPADAAAFFAVVESLNAEPEEARRRLALVMRDLIRTNPDKPAPLYV